MKLSDLTLKNISHFFEGYTKLLGNELGLLPKHIQEQVAMRAEICKDTCLAKGRCENCGCSVPGKFYVTESCDKGTDNPAKFPDLMDEVSWENYKKENNIKYE